MIYFSITISSITCYAKKFISIIITQAKMQFAERTAKLDSSIAELWLMLGPEYTGQKVSPVLIEARVSGQEVQAIIDK